jgi:four helix bundle protein
MNQSMAFPAKSVRNLNVYQLAFNTAMVIYKISKEFPKEEIYSLTDQIRRSSRSVATNLSEAWRKRKYPKHFSSKLSDATQEAAETQTWLEFSLKCGYINESVFNELDEAYEHVYAMLFNMQKKALSFCR